MPVKIEELAASNKAAVDSLLTVANTALTTAERIAALNLGAARTALEYSASATKAVLSAKDPQAAVAVQQSLVKPAMEKAADYSRSLYDISNESQQQLAKILESQFADFQKQISGMMDMAVKNAPAGSESIVAAMQTAMSQANAAFTNMSSMAKQFAETAQANIAAATKVK